MGVQLCEHSTGLRVIAMHTNAFSSHVSSAFKLHESLLPLVEGWAIRFRGSELQDPVSLALVPFVVVENYWKRGSFD